MFGDILKDQKGQKPQKWPKPFNTAIAVATAANIGAIVGAINNIVLIIYRVGQKDNHLHCKH